MLLFYMRALYAPCYAPESGGEGGGGGGSGGGGASGEGGGGGGAKTFTQEEVNGIVGKEVGKLKQKFSDYDSLKEKAVKVDELTTRISALEEEKELAGKSAEEKERARAAKAEAAIKAERDALAKERDDQKTALEAERTAHRDTRARTKLSSALSASEVHGPAAADALDMLMRESEREYDEKGDLASVTLAHNGTRYAAAELKKAAEEFLKAKPWFAKGAAGGSGTNRPNGGGTNGSTRPLYEMSDEELLKLDAQQHK